MRARHVHACTSRADGTADPKKRRFVKLTLPLEKMSARPPATNADRGRDAGAGADGDAGSGTDAGAGGSAGGSGDAASIARGLAALNVDGSQSVEESSGPSAAAAAEMRERNEVRSRRARALRGVNRAGRWLSYSARLPSLCVAPVQRFWKC